MRSLSWLYFTILIFIASLLDIQAQSYEIDANNGSTITTCGGTFYDSGGSGGNYQNNENYTIAFCSNNGGPISINFTSWNVENQGSCSYDGLRIYDGNSSASTLLGTFCSTNPGIVTSSGTCLYFEFYSDGSVVENGWAGTISCGSPPTSTSSCGSIYSYEDEFASANYNNSNGLTNWTSESWLEYGDDGNPASGEVSITSGELRFFKDDFSDPGVERNIDLSNAINVTLNFDYREASSLETADRFEVEIFNGSTWTTLLSTSNDFGSQSFSQDISAFSNINTRLRFGIRSGFSGTNEFVYIDNIDVCYDIGSIKITDVYLEAECGDVGNGWSTLSDVDASGETYVTPKLGINFVASASADISNYVSYPVVVDSAGDYKIYGRIIAPNSNDDSFWIRANGGTWYKWNGLSNRSVWTWLQIYDSDNGDTPVLFTLIDGKNNIDIATREDGTQLDKLFVTLDGTIPSGVGGPANNCEFQLGTDSDGDGIADGIDLDDDNDGILDTRESPSQIDFSNSSPLVGSLSNLGPNDKALYTDAIRDCNDILYDVVITINTKSPGITVAAVSTGINISNAIPNDDDHVTFTLSVVESGSATSGNPTGTPGIITDLTLDMQDIDSDSGNDYTEVVGFNTATAPDNAFLNNPTLIEQGGFIGGNGPSGSWTTYRLIPESGTNNWTDNDNISSAIFSPEIALFMTFTDLSEVQLVFGLTGNRTTLPSISTRATRFGATSECDRDSDGVPNRLDLDLDNDGIFDLYEAGHSELDLNNDGRIDGADTLSGNNGIFNGIETTNESGILNYTYSDTDGDQIEDPFDRDSDADGCFDTEEADVSDPDINGVAGSGTAVADANGLVISHVYAEPPTGAWQDPLDSCLEDCSNGLDDDGDGDIDDLDSDCANYFLEAECGFPGGNWDRGFDVNASNDDYLTISPGLQNLITPSADAIDLVRFTVPVDAAGIYRILARVYSADGATDSFWVRVDNGTWYNWNNWNTAATWQWIPFADSDDGNQLLRFNLAVGNHTIDIGYREDGARIDKLHLTINGSTPVGDGEEAINCGRTVINNYFLPYKLINK